MIKLDLARSYLPTKTIGKLFNDNFSAKTLERPDKWNARNVSCIPEGLYLVERDKSGRFQYYAIQDVPQRSYIEFHGGVYVTHSDGCVLVGERFDSEFNLVDSDSALSAMLDYIGDGSFLLNIRKFHPNFDNWD